jgi:hypothetical protein
MSDIEERISKLEKRAKSLKGWLIFAYILIIISLG